MSNFDKFFDRLIGNEGGYVFNPKDPGGETMWGVTKRVALEYGYNGAMRDMPRDTAKAIAKAKYWDRAHCDSLPAAIAYQVLDAAFNHGIENTIRFLQRAVEVVDDGDFGTKSFEAVQKMPTQDAVLRFLAERLAFFAKLSTWDTFGRGWANRVVSDLRYAATDL